MARPIAETPVLYGKDAIEFDKRMKQVEKQRVSKEVLARMKANYESLKAIANAVL